LKSTQCMCIIAHMKSKITHVQSDKGVLAQVASNLRRLRHAAEMSQEALAVRSGMSRRMIISV